MHGSDPASTLRQQEFSLSARNLQHVSARAMPLQPTRIDEAAECVRLIPRLQIVGQGTKSALTQNIQAAETLRTTSLTGVTDYQSSEFLITALAGTRLQELDSVLATQGQYLPFDPPLVDAGATIGGTVASGLSGAGRLKYGGLRDFIMGVRLVDGLGNVVTGGGRVVKNSAGYDIPKLMVGSCGRLGLLVEVTLKVFPRPTHSLTLRLDCESLTAAMKVCTLLGSRGIDITALEMSHTGVVELRLEGCEQAIAQTQARLIHDTGLWQVADDAVWKHYSEWQDVLPGERLTRIILPPSKVLSLEASMREQRVPRRYGAAGNVAWVRWPAEKPIRTLDEILIHHHFSGTILTGDAARCRLGLRPDAELTARLQRAFDPNQRFAGLG